jgi:hypothetical protein
MIAWNHWVPSYVRTELKKKTGIVIDEYGNQLNDDTEQKQKQQDLRLTDIKPLKDIKAKPQNKNFTPITSYKPQGSLVYNDELLGTINKI